MKKKISIIVLRSLLLFPFFLFICTSCGYKCYSSANAPSIHVPYISGDKNGYFTKELVEKIAASGLFAYRFSHDADYVLHVKILTDNIETIGYQKDIQNTGIRKRVLSPTESRRILETEIELWKGGNRIIGPKKVSTTVDFDYVDPNSILDVSFIDAQNQRVTTSTFSLGQLESFASAKEASQTPLFRNISEKIVDVIFSEW